MSDSVLQQRNAKPSARVDDGIGRGRRAILVLGMHRSGTSAVTGALTLLGAALPRRTLMGPDPCNERGLFESLALACAHDELLLAAASCWHDWRQLDAQWLRSPAADLHRQRIKKVLADEFENEPLIVVKDPRICRFVPFIRSILDDLGYGSVAVLPVRNPLEVAYSLKRRNGFALSKSGLLWLRHVLDAEFYSRDIPRCFLSYEHFIGDWRPHLKRASAKIGVAWPVSPDLSSMRINEFLSDDLHHERASFKQIGESAELAPLVLDAYAVLLKIVGEGESGELLDQLDRIRVKFDEGCRIFGPAVAAEELASADKNLVAERDGLAAALNKLRDDCQGRVVADARQTTDSIRSS